MVTTTARVPAICPGGTVLCIGSGPSLTAADLEYCRGRVDAAIAVNNAHQLAPWVTALYAADARWWEWHHGAPSFAGLKYSLSADAARWPGVQVLRNTGTAGLESDPTGLRTGRNGGYQAINLAVHFGAKRIVLIGYDMKTGPNGESHFHGDHPINRPSAFDIFIQSFHSLIEPLRQLGIEVINCTRSTKLTAFPLRSLEDTFAEVTA